MMRTRRRRDDEVSAFETPCHRGSHEQGFTIVEVLVATLVMVGVLVGTLTLFDRNNRLARSQTHIAGMQQALRTGQYEMLRTTRMAGRGGLRGGPIPEGLAVSVRNDIPQSGDDSTIAVASPASPKIVPGTDVLTVRGAFSAPIYQVNPLGGDFALDDLTNPTSGMIRLQNPHPTTGIPQDLSDIIDLVSNDPNGALILVSPLEVWSVVVIDASSSDVTSDPNDITVGFTIGSVTGTAIADRYVQMSGGFPISLRTVSSVGLLEEVRYFVREERAIVGDSTSDLVPRLMKAHFYPNSEIPRVDDPTFGVEIADNILDLQITLGVDTDGNGVIDEGDDEGGSLTKTQDDWLFNTPTDTNGSGDLAAPEKWNPIGSPLPLFYVRLTTTARTDRRDLEYQAPVMGLVQDRDFTSSPHDVYNTVSELRFRRRTLETIVNMRNL